MDPLSLCISNGIRDDLRIAAIFSVGEAALELMVWDFSCVFQHFEKSHSLCFFLLFRIEV